MKKITNREKLLQDSSAKKEYDSKLLEVYLKFIFKML